MGNAAIYSVISSTGEELGEKVLVETRRLFSEAALDQFWAAGPSAGGKKTTRNDLSEFSVVKWWREGVVRVCFSGAIFGFHLVRCSSHVATVPCSTSFNPGEFKPETTARDVSKDFQEGFVEGFKHKNPFRFLRSLPCWVIFAERRDKYSAEQLNKFVR